MSQTNDLELIKDIDRSPFEGLSQPQRLIYDSPGRTQTKETGFLPNL